jgi:hypothetical protein
VLSVELLAGLPPIRRRLSFLNERFFLMLKLEKLHRIWNNSNCLFEWQIVRESRMVSRTQFFTEFDLHFGVLTLVQKAHNNVEMGVRGLDELLFPLIALRLLGAGNSFGELQRPTAIHTDGSKTEGLVEFKIFLDDRDSYLRD